MCLTNICNDSALGRANLDKNSISPRLDIPISNTATSVFSSKFKMVRGNPIWLLKFPSVLHFEFSRKKTCYNIFRRCFTVTTRYTYNFNIQLIAIVFANICNADSVSSTKITGRFSGGFATSFIHNVATAPFSTALSTKACPSKRSLESEHTSFLFQFFSYQ